MSQMDKLNELYTLRKALECFARHNGAKNVDDGNLDELMADVGEVYLNKSE